MLEVGEIAVPAESAGDTRGFDDALVYDGFEFIHFGFCDGSVRFISENANPSLIRWLAGRNDGMVVNEDM